VIFCALFLSVANGSESSDIFILEDSHKIRDISLHQTIVSDDGNTIYNFKGSYWQVYQFSESTNNFELKDTKDFPDNVTVNLRSFSFIEDKLIVVSFGSSYKAEGTSFVFEVSQDDTLTYIKEKPIKGLTEFSNPDFSEILRFNDDLYVSYSGNYLTIWEYNQNDIEFAVLSEKHNNFTLKGEFDYGSKSISKVNSLSAPVRENGKITGFRNWINVKQKFIDENDYSISDVVYPEIFIENNYALSIRFTKFNHELNILYIATDIIHSELQDNGTYVTSGAVFLDLDKDNVVYKVVDNFLRLGSRSIDKDNDSYYTSFQSQSFKINIDWQLQDFSVEELDISFKPTFISNNLVANGLNILHRFENGVISTEELMLGGAETLQLPTKISTIKQVVHYDDSTNKLLLIGNNNKTESLFLFLWESDTHSKALNFLVKEPLIVEDLQETQIDKAILLSKEADKYVVIVNTRPNGLSAKRSYILEYTYKEGTLNKTNETLLFSNDDAFFDISTATIIKNKLIGIYHNGNDIKYVICSLDNLNVSQCTNNSLFPELGYTSKYINSLNIFPYIDDTSFIISGPKENTPVDYGLGFVVTVNDENLMTIDSEIRLAEGEEILNVSTFNNLIINGDIYKFQDESNYWLKSEIDSGLGAHSPIIYLNEEDYAVTTSLSAFIYSSDDEQYFPTGQKSNVNNSGSGYVIINDLVLTLDNGLNLYSLVDKNPAVIKYPLPFESYELLQDIEMSVDFNDYVLNIHRAEIEGLHDKLSWIDGFISGSLNNDDMFKDPEPSTVKADSFSINLTDTYTNNSLEFEVIPTNVNDAPFQTSEIPKQVLEVNDTYGGNISEYFKDPDRENVLFEFISLPSGFEGEINGDITASSNTVKKVNVEGRAFDASNEHIDFAFKVEFIPKPNSETKSSSSGGSLGVINIAFLFLLLIKINANAFVNHRLYGFTHN
jgi:hypothetical protein